MKKTTKKGYAAPATEVITMVGEGMILAGSTINLEGGAGSNSGGVGAGTNPGQETMGSPLFYSWGVEEDEFVEFVDDEE